MITFFFFTNWLYCNAAFSACVVSIRFKPCGALHFLIFCLCQAEQTVILKTPRMKAMRVAMKWVILILWLILTDAKQRDADSLHLLQVETLRLSFAAKSPGEQRSLLQCTEVSCDSGHGGDNNDAGSSHSSQESIGTLQSTLALRQPQHSPSGSSVHLCPVSAGPHVNVGDRGSPSPPGDSVLRLGQEEESFSFPKQEAEK